jgi:hypothetical protein
MRNKNNELNDTVSRLKGGQGEQGEPVGFGTFREGRYGSWLFPTKHNAEVHLRTALSGHPMEAEVHALYTSQPAPVSVVLPPYRVSIPAGLESHSNKQWNACLDKVKELNQ